MRAYFGITSFLLTLIVFFGLLSMRTNGYILFLIPISIILAIFAPKGTSKKVAVASLVISCIIYALIFGLLFIIGWELAESKLN
ncbi:hypothetical protein COM55_12230 [Bacillus pseudomycoides]|uniref:hypothetical protein n=1 Tax=Bacillus pseudomycoides TaxID=64104 RepID=UPI000BF5BF83|nr:hypothetical protein [Bacillus pseudomycoides]PGE85455.1 hypothetical protein COM55_12230 [Bacillus pseudomycoides]